jgi:beta-lactamase superfamily II metal-dependent hydrolase
VTVPKAALEVYAFNVRFGDAILVRVPDKDRHGSRTTRRHILIDVGNAPSGAQDPNSAPQPGQAGGDDTVLTPAVDAILQVLNGAPLDLYVMTHEHMDHAQGLPYAEKHGPAGRSLRAILKPKHVWMTASAEGAAYYARHPQAKKEFDRARAAYAAIAAHLATAAAEEKMGLGPILANNNPVSTSSCVDWLRALVPDGAAPGYVHREVPKADLAKLHPFEEATFEIWAPEEDTSAYYGRVNPMALGDGTPAVLPAMAPAPRVVPPPGVDAASFLHLVDLRRRGIQENLLTIDKAANNSSIVFCLEWRGWRLLFAGDAEQKSWRMMKAKGVLKPVHFLKVSHHGSVNGTPDPEILDLVLPTVRPDRKKRTAMVSTWDHTYGGIPHTPTDDLIKSRCNTFLSTLAQRDKPFVVAKFS